jgi:hypothetical protein
MVRLTVNSISSSHQGSNMGRIRPASYSRTCIASSKPNCPVHVWCDNLGMLALADHDTSHRRPTHIAVRFHSVRELFAREDVTLQYVPSKENTAVLFTKSLGKGRLDYLCEKVGIKSSLHA